MVKSMTRGALAAVAIALASVGVQSQAAAAADANTLAQQSPHVADVQTLAEWEYNSIYEAGGVRAEYMLTEEVFGPAGEEIGNVENAIINAQGQIVALIIEVGGVWEIGDTNIVVPWEQVRLIPDGFQVPVSEDNYGAYLLFSEHSFVTTKALQQTHPVNEEVATGARTWKLSALLNDYVVLENGLGYGYLDDVIFSKDGRIMALMVTSSLAYGLGVYAYPFYGHAWQPNDDVYRLPYARDAVDTLAPFDYGLFEGFWE